MPPKVALCEIGGEKKGLSPYISECDDLALRETRVSRLELESHGELHHPRTSAAETRIALRDVGGLSRKTARTIRERRSRIYYTTR